MNTTTIQPTLKMTDIHTHILFGMDDGAQDVQASLEMIYEQIDQGVTQVVFTPHYGSNDDLESFIDKRNRHYEILKQAVKEKELQIELKVGAEIMFTREILSMDLSDLVIEGTNYLLLEFPTRFHIDHIEASMNQLINDGYDPIFAHFERYSFLREDLELMKNLLELGVLYQVNASSISKKSDNNFLEACLKKDYIHLIASDAHNTSSRRPNMNIKKIKKNQFDKLQAIYENSNKVFNNESIVKYEHYKPLKRMFGKYY